jgi:hypothetical protein
LKLTKWLSECFKVVEQVEVQKWSPCGSSCRTGEAVPARTDASASQEKGLAKPVKVHAEKGSDFVLNNFTTLNKIFKREKTFLMMIVGWTKILLVHHGSSIVPKEWWEILWIPVPWAGIHKTGN